MNYKHINIRIMIILRLNIFISAVSSKPRVVEVSSHVSTGHYGFIYSSFVSLLPCLFSHIVIPRLCYLSLLDFTFLFARLCNLILCYTVRHVYHLTLLADLCLVVIRYLLSLLFWYPLTLLFQSNLRFKVHVACCSIEFSWRVCRVSS